MTGVKKLFVMDSTEMLIFIAALLIRALYALFVQITAGSHGFIAFSDAEFFYYQAALNLLNHHAFSIAPSAPYLPEAYHTPLYPFFITVLLFLHFPLFGVVVVQDILCASTILLLYKIGIKLTASKHIALAAALIAVFEPMSIYWSGLLMSDTLWAFFTIVSLYLLIEEYCYLSVFFLGVSAWARPISLYFMPAFIGMIAYQQWVKGREVKKGIKKAGAAFMLFLACVFPWYLHNKVVFGTWSFSSAGWYLMYYFPVNVFAHTKNLTWVPLDPAPPADYTRFDFKYTPIYEKASLATISQDKIGFASVYLGRSLYSFVSNRYDYLVHVVFASKMPGLYMRTPAWIISFILAMGELFWIFIYVFDALALLDKRLLPWWVFFVALLAINALLSGGINPVGTDMSRYTFGLFPFYFVFAGVGWRKLNEFIRHFR